jgi:hypothetical protein
MLTAQCSSGVPPNKKASNHQSNHTTGTDQGWTILFNVLFAAAEASPLVKLGGLRNYSNKSLNRAIGAA